jgi:hypothetical protein
MAAIAGISKRQTATRGTSFSMGFAMYRQESRSKSVILNPQFPGRTLDEDSISEEWMLVPTAWSKLSGISITWTRSLGNWQYIFGSIRVVADDDRVFLVCASGDLPALIRPLSSREATLSDVNDQGESLLHVRQSNSIKSVFSPFFRS